MSGNPATRALTAGSARTLWVSIRSAFRRSATRRIGRSTGWPSKPSSVPFVTTSSFKGTAEEFVTRGSSTKVVLVDGQRLIDLMLEHEIGVRVKQTHRVLEVDQNFFAEE